SDHGLQLLRLLGGDEDALFHSHDAFLRLESLDSGVRGEVQLARDLMKRQGLRVAKEAGTAGLHDAEVLVEPVLREDGVPVRVARVEVERSQVEETLPCFERAGVIPYERLKDDLRLRKIL